MNAFGPRAGQSAFGGVLRELASTSPLMNGSSRMSNLSSMSGGLTLKCRSLPDLALI